MKHDYKVYVLAVLAGILFTFTAAPPAFAEYDEGYDECEYDCEEPDEDPSSTSEAEANARARARSDANARATAFGGFGYGEGGDASAGALGVGIVKTDTEVTVEGDVFEAADVKGAAEVLQRRAATAPDSRSRSAGNNDACGDSTGLSGQAGIAGGSLSTVPEACRAFRSMASEQQLTEAGYSKRAAAVNIVYWIGFPFRTILHVASFGILN